MSGSTDTGRVAVHFPNRRSGRAGGNKPEHAFRADRHAERARARRKVMAGFPILEPFRSKQDVDRYLGQPKIQCLLCGKWYKRLAGHLRIHEISEDEYRERYRIPWSAGLLGTEAWQKYSASAHRMISRVGENVVNERLSLGRKAMAAAHPRHRRSPWKSEIALDNLGDHIRERAPRAGCLNCGIKVPRSGGKYCSHLCYRLHSYPDAAPPANCRTCDRPLPRGSWGKASESPVQCKACRYRSESA